MAQVLGVILDDEEKRKENIGCEIREMTDVGVRFPEVTRYMNRRANA